MRLRDNPQLPHRVIEFNYQRCVVPNCMVWSLALDAWGMCPTHLWDHHHEEYADRVHSVGLRHGSGR